MTWRDILRTLVFCAILLSLVLHAIWVIETNMEIRSLQSDVEHLKATQRPLVNIDGGKYLTIFTQEDEVIIQTVKGEK